MEKMWKNMMSVRQNQNMSMKENIRGTRSRYKFKDSIKSLDEIARVNRSVFRAQNISGLETHATFKGISSI